MKSNILLFTCLLISLFCAHVLSDQQFHGVKDAVLLNDDGNDKENVVNREAVYAVKGQKGKGAYGGANLDHKPSRSGTREMSVFSGSSAIIVSLLCTLIRVFVF